MTIRTSTEIQTEIDATTAERDSINARLKALRAELKETSAAEAAAAAEALGRELITAKAEGPIAFAAFLKDHGLDGLLVSADGTETDPVPAPAPVEVGQRDGGHDGGWGHP